MFNTPLLCLQHPSGYRNVQDFRALNQKDHREPIKFKKVDETLLDIETSKPKIFSTLDLSNLVWQMNFLEEQAAHTAFTTPGQGQFQWKQTPLGVMGPKRPFIAFWNLYSETSKACWYTLTASLSTTTTGATIMRPCGRCFRSCRGTNYCNTKKT